MSIRVLLADDQALVRGGFRMILEAKDDLEVVGEAEDGAQAAELAEQHRPDVVLMDVRMPVLDGIEATRRIVASGNSARIIVLTTFDADEYVFAALRAGASGFLLKDVRPADLVEAIRIVARGDALLAPTVTRRLLDRFAMELPDTDSAPPDLGELTERELEVLRPRRARAVERRDRRPARRQRGDGEDARLRRAAQAPAARPRAGRRARLRRRARAAALILKSEMKSSLAPDAPSARRT